MSGIITLITDFSTSDHYVGTMKGVILSINPNVTIIDIAHEIAAHDISQAAFVLKNSYKYFPEGTVHMAVVDPGVGSNRRRVAMHCGGHYFVGPDNGVFSYPIRDRGLCECVSISVPEEKIGVASTFEGRDIFAPTAAKIAMGVPLSELGEAISDPVKLQLPKPKISDKMIEGQIVYIDHFGNCCSNIEVEDLAKLGGTPNVWVGGFWIGPVRAFYSEVEPNETLAVINSMDHLEIAVNQGNAKQELNLQIGSRVKVEIRD